MSLRDRVGIDVGNRLRLEDALEWAAEHEVRWIDIQLDTGPNALSSFDEARATGVRRACERHSVHLGLHTSSAVNVAEVAPYVSDAVAHYLEAYVEIAPRLGAEWIVMHSISETGRNRTAFRDGILRDGAAVNAGTSDAAGHAGLTHPI